MEHRHHQSGNDGGGHTHHDITLLLGQRETTDLANITASTLSFCSYTSPQKLSTFLLLYRVDSCVKQKPRLSWRDCLVFLKLCPFAARIKRCGPLLLFYVARYVFRTSRLAVSGPFVSVMLGGVAACWQVWLATWLANPGNHVSNRHHKTKIYRSRAERGFETIFCPFPMLVPLGTAMLG